MNLNRVNWAELNEVNDLWEICDAISAGAFFSLYFLLIYEVSHFSKKIF